MTFQLEPQEIACTSKPFAKPRKVELPNGLVIKSRWYTPPKIEARPPVPLNPDVTLPNGIVLRATAYRLPGWGQRSPEAVKACDKLYRIWKAAKDGKPIPQGTYVRVRTTNGRERCGWVHGNYTRTYGIQLRVREHHKLIEILAHRIKTVEVVL